ncbi:hypothetical protein M436DRAFT_80707 [Aureobasidium namibiae CBS 147.97]|uniref:Uncharacterized protein n=1 Tax=Aureobasidium namibiae CBS 147.97 TaxID=1043004 RepID=A0A074XI63_9PEZI
MVAQEIAETEAEVREYEAGLRNKQERGKMDEANAPEIKARSTIGYKKNAAPRAMKDEPGSGDGNVNSESTTTSAGDGKKTGNNVTDDNSANKVS